MNWHAALLMEHESQQELSCSSEHYQMFCQVSPRWKIGLQAQGTTMPFGSAGKLMPFCGLCTSADDTR